MKYLFFNYYNCISLNKTTAFTIIFCYNLEIEASQLTHNKTIISFQLIRIGIIAYQIYMKQAHKKCIISLLLLANILKLIKMHAIKYLEISVP